jgi:hypothetical protein
MLPLWFELLNHSVKSFPTGKNKNLSSKNIQTSQERPILKLKKVCFFWQMAQ